MPLDLEGSAVTGMHVSIVFKLRQVLGLDAPGTPFENVPAMDETVGEYGHDPLT